jgi:2Fe-2S ferredoxin
METQLVKITFLQHSGTVDEVAGVVGSSLMKAAVSNGVPGIDADCGGACACGTCHVFIEPEWVALTGEASEAEFAMLEYQENRQPTSRLACQITLTGALDGLTVRLPKGQF